MTTPPSLFGFPVVEVEAKDMPENPEITLGDFSPWVTWRLRMTPLARYLANRARRQAHAARVAAKRIHRKRERRGWYRYQE